MRQAIRAGRIQARAAFRLGRVGLHLAGGVVIATLVFPLSPRALRHVLQQRWCALLLRILAVRLYAGGPTIERGALLVANHISWLDILALNALHPLSFVSKDDVRRWPVIGGLVRRSGTLLLRRDSPRAARMLNAEIAARLAAGESIVVFPEGTTTDGARVLPFHGALLQSALAQGRCVQPIALAYRDSETGSRSAAAVYTDDTSFWASLCAIARAPCIDACISVTPPIVTQGLDRRSVATAARRCIENAIACLRRAPAAAAQKPDPQARQTAAAALGAAQRLARS